MHIYSYFSMDVFQAYDVEALLPFLIALVVVIASFISILYVILGWFQMVLSWWEEEKVKKAINSIRFSVFGVIVIIFLIYIFSVISDMIGFPLTKEYVNPEVVFENVQKIINFIFQSDSSSSWLDFDSLPLDNELPPDFIDL